MKNKKQKPTNKEMVQEINFLGQRVYENNSAIRSAIVVIENYIEWKGDKDEFKDFMKAKAEKKREGQTSVKDILDEQSSSKSEEPETAETV